MTEFKQFSPADRAWSFGLFGVDIFEDPYPPSLYHRLQGVVVGTTLSIQPPPGYVPVGPWTLTDPGHRYYEMQVTDPDMSVIEFQRTAAR